MRVGQAAVVIFWLCEKKREVEILQFSSSAPSPATSGALCFFDAVSVDLIPVIFYRSSLPLSLLPPHIPRARPALLHV